MDKHQGITEQERMLLLDKHTFSKPVSNKAFNSDYIPRSMKTRKKNSMFNIFQRRGR